MTKEKPIIFSSEMVRAILDGRKTMTRRVIKKVPICWSMPPARYKEGFFNRHGCEVTKESIKCPYKVGNRLWVRETFCPVNDIGFGGKKWIDYRATPKYSASHPAGWYNAPEDAEALKWKPSIYMPRWASRITLEIIDIRVERLQEISQKCSYNEGVENVKDFKKKYGMNARGAFIDLWNSIHKKEHRWQDNPWIWIIAFRKD